MSKNKKIIIVGAGEAGIALLQEYVNRGLVSLVLGFIDDDSSKIEKEFESVKVLGKIADIKDVVLECSITEVVIAIPSAKSELLNEIITNVHSSGKKLNIHIVPSSEKFFERAPLIPTLESIQFSELFERDEFSIDIDKIQGKLRNKVVLITGAGGSIGSEICKQLLKFDVKKIVAVGRGENSIYNLMKLLNGYLDYMKIKPEIVYKIADVKDFTIMKSVFETEKPEIVFHAAAHKHVPLMEFNETEAIQNNVGGTLNILKLSSLFQIKKFVLVSTDKAVRPANIMGATKRVTEMLTDYYSLKEDLNTTIVRFGNVIGSRGSVIPLFCEQIEKGGPVTVTHPDITRYFMSIPEASLLVINASVLDHKGNICVLDMGQQHKISEIAKKLIKLYYLEPDVDIKIEYTGLRPGEKMFEELFYDKSNMVKTENEKIFMLNVEKNLSDYVVLQSFLENELDIITTFSSNKAREILKKLVPEYISD